ncbi:hypothetical protein MBLNU457_5855t1 [Dothideomycetes sp. NU457]
MAQARPRQVSQPALLERSPSPLFVQRDITPTREQSPRRQRLLLPPLVPAIRDYNYGNEGPQLHERRPGFDYRRPAATTMRPRRGSGNIIDLTEDGNDATGNAVPQPRAEPATRRQRLPNFGREIIDLSADASPVGAEGGNHTHTGPTLRRESSSEVVFVSERPRSETPHPAAGARRGQQQQPIFADLTEDDDDDIVVVRTASRAGRPGANLQPPVVGGNVRARNNDIGIAQIFARERPHNGHGGHLFRRLGHALGIGDGDEHFFEDLLDDGFDVVDGPGAHFRRMPAARPFMPPGFMVYDRPGFAMGGERTRDPTPEYQAPPALPKGFTGDPRDDEPVVCPACGDELAIGDSEEKRQVWVVKNCGHVYCGFCIKNRGKKSKASSKGKGRADLPIPKHFSECVVDGCNSKVTGKTHVQQIFL